MGQRYNEISDSLKQFIEKQKIFFVATACAEGRVNVSPKGMDCLRVVGSNRVVWLNLTGSGNETAAHIREHPRMTLMFAAFDGSPMILRLYGQATAVHHNDHEWNELYAMFRPMPAARQIFDVNVDLVQTSCGMGVPRFDYIADREQLHDWASARSQEEIRQYWAEKNDVSLDGKPAHILDRNT